MRGQCCRTCGFEMEPELRCEICRNFIRLQCPKCGRTNDSQIHIHHNQ